RPGFGTLTPARSAQSPWRILYMINAAKHSALALTQKLAAIAEVELTVTVGRDEKLRGAMERLRATSAKPFQIIGWMTELPKLLGQHHLLISKAGGATVQEAIAAKCPMIINQIVPGQEQGNAQLIAETNAGCVALCHEEAVSAVMTAIRHDAKQLKEWSANIAKISRPTAALDIAEFLLAL